MRVGVILPSRGLIFSQTADELLQNLQGIPHTFFFSHRKPIPDCFEQPTIAALADDEVTHLWFVEDDMVLAPDTLNQMIQEDKAVVTADYPVNDKGRGAIFRDKSGKILICGTGCTLVKREVFDELKLPYFRTDIRWTVKNMGDFIKLTRSETTDIDGYGLHDVNFCMNLHRLEIPIHAIKRKLKQRKLVELGKPGSNNGAHNIKVLTRVEKDQLLKEVMSWPATETGDLVTVNTPSGEVNVSKSHAKTLVSKGLATLLPKQASVVEWGAQ